MKDQPPERDRQSDFSRRRIEANFALVLASALTILFLVGYQNNEFAQQLGQTSFLPPAGWTPLLGVLAFIVLNAIYVAGETSVELLKPVHIKFAREDQPQDAKRLQAVLDRKAKFVAACTLASDFCRVAMIFVALFLAPGLSNWMADRLGREADGSMFIWSLLLVVLPIALLNLMFELVPKSYASLSPHRVAIRLYNVIRWTSAILSPLATLLSSVAGLLTARFGGRASFTMANQAEEEIKNLVETAQETGEIEVEEKELLHSVFEFSDTVAREVMTPRVDLEAMRVTSDPTELVELIKKTGKSRIPLYEETDDQIVGIVHAKDLLMAVLKTDRPSLRKIMRPAIFVPENKSLNELLREMRQSRSEMAIVQDEFGGTSGIVTTEDIVEELVGEIVDEYDVEEPEIVKVDGDCYLVHGKVHVDDVNDTLGSELVSEEFDTIGGYVFGVFGRQPKRDEKIESDGLRFTVVEADGRKIKRLKIEKLPVEVEATLFED